MDESLGTDSASLDTSREAVPAVTYSEPFDPAGFAAFMDTVPNEAVVWLDSAGPEIELAWTKRKVSYDKRMVNISNRVKNGYMVQTQERLFQYLEPLPDGEERPVWTGPAWTPQPPPVMNT